MYGIVVAAALGLSVGASFVERALLMGLLALGMCWGSNTVSHIHLHRPLFQSSFANAAFGVYLTLLLGVPQRLWKRRHLAHHALRCEAPARGRVDVVEAAALLAGLALLGSLAGQALRLVWAPSLALGLVLCALQGRGEHAGAEIGVDHHGAVYNRLWFNDGYHAAHHRRPEAHWTELPRDVRADDVKSAWPPVLRFVEDPRSPVLRLLEGLHAALNAAQAVTLDALERVALRSRALRGLLLATHGRAMGSLLATIDTRSVRRVLIVGGGLFPRSALLLMRLLPRARLVLVDRSPENLARASAWLSAHDGRAPALEMIASTFDPQAPHPHARDRAHACDLLVVPLALRGDRQRLYTHPPAPLVLVHDWIWRERGDRGARVSWLLFKRLNLVIARAADPSRPASGRSSLDGTRPPWPFLPELPEIPPCSRPASSSAFASATRPRS